MGLTGAVSPWKFIDPKEQPNVESRKNLIAEENKKEGTTDWQLTYVRSKNYRPETIEGYCSHTSVGVGDSIDVYVSANPASEVSIYIYRMGYYGGKGGRHMGAFGPFFVKAQPIPLVGENRLRECKWERAVEMRIPEDWVSGVYLGKLSSESNRYQSYIIFVVRDSRMADILVQTSDTTWQAYNKWPNNYSLYDSDPPQDVPGFEVLAAGDVMRSDNTTSPYAATIYPGPKGNWVYNTATIYWSLGLAHTPGMNLPFSHLGRPHGPDERVQKIMTNFLNGCGI